MRAEVEELSRLQLDCLGFYPRLCRLKVHCWLNPFSWLCFCLTVIGLTSGSDIVVWSCHSLLGWSSSSCITMDKLSHHILLEPVGAMLIRYHSHLCLLSSCIIDKHTSEKL